MPTTTDLALAHDVRIAVMRLARRLRAERADSPLSLTQLAALATVERHGPLTPGELADHERVSPPSITKVIAALEAAGLVARTPHPSDGRQSLVAISKSGAKLLRDDRRQREAWLARRLVELDDTDRTALRAVLPLLERLASG
jgi:DNA-binding MarR family transcriptional regulator